MQARPAARPGATPLVTTSRTFRRAARLRQPVVSVGNLALGGRGKTPLVAFLARLLVAHGERPAILTRGYHRTRREDGVVIVSDGHRIQASLDQSGDEPLMLAESLPGVRVLVSEIRAIAGTLAERALGATIHLLDDGFQHRALARDLDLVLVAPEDLADRRVPFGRLREEPTALGRADAVIVDGDTVPDRMPPTDALFRLRRTLGPPVPLAGSAGPIGRTGPVLALAGIARPERFRAALEADGWQVVRFLSFPDHHPFSTRDLETIGSAARDAGASAVLTTAKDAIRLRHFEHLPVAVAAVPLAVTVEPAEAFEAWFVGRVRAAHESRA